MKIPSKKELIAEDAFLAQKFKVSIKTIQRWKDNYGLRKINKRLTKLEVEEIRMSKATVKSLAKKYDKTLAAIYRVKNNVTHKKGPICSGDAFVL